MFAKTRMADPLSKVPSNRLVYDGAVFRIEFYVAPGGAAPAEAWLEQLTLAPQQKFAALFARMGDTGKIGWSTPDFDAWIQEGRRQNAQTRNRPSRSVQERF
jgi:hypothetical protein